MKAAAGRHPRDTRKTGDPVDIVSPPRQIEVKAFGKIARGQPLPLEQRQVGARHEDPVNFYLYIVDSIDDARAGLGKPQVVELDGPAVAAMLTQADHHLLANPVSG